MFEFNQLNSIHLEITSRCQASCPMCIRNIDGGLINPKYKATDWSFDDFKNIITADIINQISVITFCGNLGDPITNDNLLDMIRYVNVINKNIFIGIHTNGSMRSVDWWKELSSIMTTNQKVIFALDGLEDTHNLYRIGTNFNKIIENAKSFITAGGNAEWAFIVFKHNQHQIEEAKNLSKLLGFKTFQVKNSIRFVGEPFIKVKNKHGNVTHLLEPADSVKIKYINNSILENYRDIVNMSEINCIVKKDKSIYVDHIGDVYPCCWLGAVPYTFNKLNDKSHLIREEINKEHMNMLSNLGEINSFKSSIKEIISSNSWQTLWEKIWKNKSSIVCARTCGVVKGKFSQPKDQFSDRYEFDE